MAFDALKNMLSQSNLQMERENLTRNNPYVRLNSILNGISNIGQTQESFTRTAMSKEKLQQIKEVANIKKGVRNALSNVVKFDKKAIKKMSSKNEDEHGIFANDIATLEVAKNKYPEYAEIFEEQIVNIKNMVQSSQKSSIFQETQENIQDSIDRRTLIKEYAGQLDSLQENVEQGNSVLGQVADIADNMFTASLNSSFIQSLNEEDKKKLKGLQQKVLLHMEELTDTLDKKEFDQKKERQLMSYLRIQFMNYLYNTLHGQGNFMKKLESMNSTLENMITKEGLEELKGEDEKEKRNSPEEYKKKQEFKNTVLRKVKTFRWESANGGDRDTKKIIKDIVDLDFKLLTEEELKEIFNSISQVDSFYKTGGHGRTIKERLKEKTGLELSNK